MSHVKILNSIFTHLIIHRLFGTFFMRNYKLINSPHFNQEWLSKLCLQVWKYEQVFGNFSYQIHLRNHQNHQKTFWIHQQKPSHKFPDHELWNFYQLNFLNDCTNKWNWLNLHKRTEFIVKRDLVDMSKQHINASKKFSFR